MIAYLDSSVLVRAYLPDEAGHDDVLALLDDPDVALVTGTWTLIEVSGALVRAARTGRVPTPPLALLDADLAVDGRVSVVAAGQDEVERIALGLVRQHGMRAMDAWHLATAELVLPALGDSGETLAFVTRDREQAAVAASRGLVDFSATPEH